MSSNHAHREKKPCRHCGTKTTQRAQGVPYCSMGCIGGKRRENKTESYECPYPDCRFSRSWLPENSLSKTAAHVDIETHRREHGQEPDWNDG